MITPGDGGTGPDRLGPMNPQLALRVAIIGGLTLVLFAIIFLRLWVLQVLTSNQYVQEAAAVSSREISVAAPRGEIIDRNGTILVGSTRSPAIQIAPDSLPVKITDTKADLSTPPVTDQVIYDKVSKLLKLSTKPERCTYKLWIGPKEREEHAKLTPVACTVAKDIAQSPYANATIKTNVSTDVQAYLAERQTQYPGVVSTEIYTRSYPQGTLAAQLFGTVGPITATEIKDKEFKGVPETDSVGQSGLELEYNKYLQGTDGYEKVKVNATGTFEGYEQGKAAKQGDTLQLSLDAKLQKVGQESLEESIEKNDGTGGAFVAMDPENGEIYAMGSLPSYNPTIFTKPISEKEYEKEFGASTGDPLINRAIESAGAVGSTFKVITATAALESGVTTADSTYDDTGEFCYPGTDTCLHNSGDVANGSVNLISALEVSDDVYFYHLGYEMNSSKPEGGALQKWAKAFGIGEKTGVDLPDEVSGVRPSPAWVAGEVKLERECEDATGPYKGDRKRSSCGIAEKDATWTVGQNVEMGVGQGMDEITPLQMAVVYSAIANRGTIITPHVGMDIESSSGTILDRIDPGAKRKLDINPFYLDSIWRGLYEAANSSSGTSGAVMGSFGKTVYGKTGTAEVGETTAEASSNPDTAWYACFVPSTVTKKPIVVIVTVTGGGFGSVAAAPVARQILSEWFYGKAGRYITVTASVGGTA